jgi:hypothetical protein
MSLLTLIIMIFVIGIVWGGLVFFLTKAIKFEKNKSNVQE